MFDHRMIYIYIYVQTAFWQKLRDLGYSPQKPFWSRFMAAYKAYRPCTQLALTLYYVAVYSFLRERPKGKLQKLIG